MLSRLGGVPPDAGCLVLCSKPFGPIMSWQKAYWKQRGEIKWVTLGSENSQFFHYVATIQHRNNNIASLVLLYLPMRLTQHYCLILKERLGQTDHFDIPPGFLNLLQSHAKLAFLEDLFSHDEIDAIIKDLPSNKSPGPDGFNCLTLTL